MRALRRRPLRIRVRIVAAVVLAMTVVLLAADGFVYWRVSVALDQQLDQDLVGYARLVELGVRAHRPLPADDPGLVSQVYRRDGRLLDVSDRGVIRLLDERRIAGATADPASFDIGNLLPPAEHPYRVRYFTVARDGGTVVVAAAISRHKHDEALRELMGQLALAYLATVLAAGVVGWAATRAALGPVERYRAAAAAAGGDPRRRLPVEEGRDDELTRLGSTFNSLLAEIEDGQERERRFLADASHELRSPLAVMAAEVEWARHRPRTEAEIARVLDSLGEQTQRLVGLANALLDLEEVGAASAPGSDEVTPAELVAASSGGAREHLAGLGRNLVLHASGDAVRVDRPWVELVARNLLGNAVKHGRGTVTVTASAADGLLRLRVTDEGGGIPADLGYRAFDRFARGEESRTTPGNGLGLALVAGVAQRHHGRAVLVPGGVELELPANEAQGSKR